MKKLRSLVVVLGVLLYTVMLAGTTDSGDDPVQDPPNVLFIAVDDLNTWLGCLGGFSNTKTPNMDKLAAQGVLFSNAHCQAPLCGPSRASLMTGLRPSTTGIYGMIPDDSIRSQNLATKDIIFLPEYFRNHGYHTMGIGKLFHHHSPTGCFTNRVEESRGLDRFRKSDLFGMATEHRIGKTTAGPVLIGGLTLQRIH